MLIEILSSDNFLYPIYLAIKAAYLPALWFDGGFLLAQKIAIALFCAQIAVINATNTPRWLQLALIAAGWALLGNIEAKDMFILSLPIWPFLFWRRRYWGLALALFGVAVSCLIGFCLGQLDQRHTDELYYYVGIIAFVVVRVKFVFLKRFRAPFIALAFIFLAFYSVPIIYEKYGEEQLAKQYLVQPKLTWVKEPKKGETLRSRIAFNTEFLGKKYESIAIVYDYVEAQSHYKDGEVITNLDKIYAYTPVHLRAKNKVYHFSEIIKNNFHYQDFKDYVLYSEITANYDEINRQIKLKEIR